MSAERRSRSYNQHCWSGYLARHHSRFSPSLEHRLLPASNLRIGAEKSTLAAKVIPVFSAFPWRRSPLIFVGVLVGIYAVAVFRYAYLLPYVGLHSAFDRTVRGFDGVSRGISGPAGGVLQVEDEVVELNGRPVRSWPDLIHSIKDLADAAPTPKETLTDAESAGLTYVRLNDDEKYVLIRFIRPGAAGGKGMPLACWCLVSSLPSWEMIPSILWFALKCGLFMVGALVFWKRPSDAPARQFYVLCMVTLGAYMGGYHWSHIVSQPILIVVFMACAIALPAALFHFNLVFPRPNPLLQRYPNWTLGCVYGLPLAFLVVMATTYGRVRWDVSVGAEPDEINRLLAWLLAEIYAYLGVALLWYLGGIAALVQSYRDATDEMERNQVKWILSGALLALIPIGASLYLAALERNAFGAGAATWPMFAASTCLTAAFIVGILNYRLMQLDQIISSGMFYFVVSFLAVAVYYVVVILGMYIAGTRVGSPLAQALAVSTTALVLMLGLDMMRSRFKKSLDRRFYRAKFQLDRTLQRMGQAIEQLVDPTTLARTLLQAAADVLGVRRGAVYVREGNPPIYRLVDSLGDPPALTELAYGCPLVEGMQASAAVLALGGRAAAADPLQRQLHFLGGEMAHAVAHEGHLVAILVLGRKEAGHYTEDDLNLLGAFAQLTALALKSAERHRTIDVLSRDLQTKVEKISEQQRRILMLQSQLTRQGVPVEAAAPTPPQPTPTPGIVGSSGPVQQVLGLVKKVSASQSAVLIRGESGTGKGLLAQALHESSPRAGKAFVKVHCAALSPGLLESELFGHVKGAFTNALRDKVGRFEMADGGTLFLDEIGDISLDVQTKLLRVLQEMTFERVGSSEPMKVDVRIIAATHQNLEELIRAGRFREDLYYRLNVISILMPPLRERREDIPELVQHFLALHAQRCGKPIPPIDDDALVCLKACSWPGNIRQLENVIERAVVVAEGPSITVLDLPGELRVSADKGQGHAAPAPPTGTNGIVADREHWERERLVRALAAADGNKAEAARALGLARSTLLSRLKRHGLS
jgi:transcriptional regulator with GAF, ATPase, and Fis domain